MGDNVLMKRGEIGFFLAMVLIFVLVGCAPAGANVRRTQDISMQNFWEFLSITIVQDSPGSVRLQVFPVDHRSEFRDVYISYTVFTQPVQNGAISSSSESRVLRLDAMGRGETQGCAVVYPIMRGITGAVTHYLR